MKVVAKNIEMIAYFDLSGKIQPLRFRIEEETGQNVIKISRLIKTETEKFCGNKMMVYTCSAVVNNVEKILEIKYDISNMKWILFKI